MSRAPMYVLLASMLAIPIAGFATYAVAPGPHEPSSNLILVAYPFVLLAIGVLGVWLWQMRARKRLVAAASLSQGLVVILVVWPCVVLAISTLLFMVEPAFAITNLSVNLAWFLLWIPRPMRSIGAVRSFEIAAPADRVFAFITEPANWPRYNEGVESASVSPPGPLAVNCEVTTVTRLVYDGVRGPNIFHLPEAVETTSVVTELVPGRSFSSRRIDGPLASDKIDVAAVESGTRITVSERRMLPYGYAVFGTGLDLIATRASRRERARRSQDRLRRLLEPPPPAR